MKVTTQSDLTDAAGRVIYIQNPRYPKTTAFNIESVERVGDDTWWLTTELEPILATNVVTDVDAQRGTVVSPYNMAKQRECARLFNGKVIVRTDTPGQLMRIRSARTRSGAPPTQTIKLLDKEHVARFAPGETYAIYDYGPGDTWYMCHAEVESR